MGFDPERVDWALQSTNHAGMQAALDHLEAHQDEPLPKDWRTTDAAPPDGAAAEASQTAAKVR